MLVKRFAAVNTSKKLLLSEDGQFYTLKDDWKVFNTISALFMSKEAAQSACARVHSPKFKVLEVEFEK